MDLEKLTQIIRHKSKSLPEGVNIISPEELPSETKADWLITLLSRMYVEHGITKHRDQLVADIDSGNCRIWFATKDNLPIGSAAQVKQSDQAVEIGRAVSLTNGVGGLLMLLAASDHFSRSDQPLVAEVRIADDFMGIPSGEATQVICFKHLAMIPHACIPAFNHGQPNSQEMFVFSSSQPFSDSEPAFLPDKQSILGLLASTALKLITSRFHPKLTVRTSPDPQPHRRGWEIARTRPFSVLIPTSPPTKLETAVNKAEKESPFTLIPLELHPSSSPAVLECLNLGFIPCGIDRQPGPQGHPVLLLGKLRPGTLLAPLQLAHHLHPDETQAVNLIDRTFRARLR